MAIPRDGDREMAVEMGDCGEGDENGGMRETIIEYARGSVSALARSKH
jgi:hypothetical protein